MILAVIGSKEFHDYQILKSILDTYSKVEVIVSGAAIGTDLIATRYANKNNIKIIEFPPDYKKFGNNAKHIRNKLIVEECDELIAFCDGKCEGTKYTMDYAKKLGKPVKIIKVMIA